MIYQISDDDWNNIKAAEPGEFTSLTAGGYVCKIIHAEFGTSKAGNDMLILDIDIAEGDFANYFQNTVKRFNQSNWPNSGVYRQLVLSNDKTLSPFFKGLIEIIEQSNSNFVARQDGGINPASLVGKLCGFVFAEEDYTKQDGSDATRIVVRTPKTVDDIREGNFKIYAAKSKKVQGQTVKPTAKNVANDVDLDNPPF